MPAVFIACPSHLFSGKSELRASFLSSVQRVVAIEMDAINPKDGKMTAFGEEPGKYIDLILQPYRHGDVLLTTPLVGTIVSYGWPDRMLTIEERLQRISDHARRLLVEFDLLPDDDTEIISFTFLDKAPGAWAVSPNFTTPLV